MPYGPLNDTAVGRTGVLVPVMVEPVQRGDDAATIKANLRSQWIKQRKDYSF